MKYSVDLSPRYLNNGLKLSSFERIRGKNDSKKVESIDLNIKDYRKSTKKLTLQMPTRPILKKTSSELEEFSGGSPKVPVLGLNKLNNPIFCTKPLLSRNLSHRSVKLSISPRTLPKTFEFPMKPTEALVTFNQCLTSYEQGEILKFSEIYFIGNTNNKVRPSAQMNNFGFDNENSDYIVIKNDHISFRYEIQDLIGKGSFGQVLECLDHKYNEKVAVKIIKNKPKFHRQARSEIKILEKLEENDTNRAFNTVKMKNFFLFRNHMCIVFELLHLNLYEYLYQNDFEGLPLNLVRQIAKQILKTLEFLKSLEVIHCDLKLENILFSNITKGLIKIIDYGSSCFVSERIHTYIQSRYYRAPEVILGISYSFAIDMWSFGCILVELFTGKPLLPGSCESEQLLNMISYFGTPPNEVLAISTRKQLFFDGNTLKNRKFQNGKTCKPKMFTLKALIGETNAEFLNFLEKCFEWDGHKRMTPTEGLTHKWIMNKNS